VNLPQGTAKSRSQTRPLTWQRRCQPYGYFTRAFEIAWQRSKEKFANTSIFSSGTRTFDSRADLQVDSLQDLRFRSYRPSAVAEQNSYDMSISWVLGVKKIVRLPFPDRYRLNRINLDRKQTL
jgi:hypothetical protein